MSSLLMGAAWAAVGVIAARTDRHERSPVWVMAGALLGPLWVAVRVDRPQADRLQPVLVEVRPSRLVPRGAHRRPRPAA